MPTSRSTSRSRAGVRWSAVDRGHGRGRPGEVRAGGPRLAAFHSPGMGASPSLERLLRRRLDRLHARARRRRRPADPDRPGGRAGRRGRHRPGRPASSTSRSGGASPMCARSRSRTVVAAGRQRRPDRLVGAELECTLLGQDGEHATSGAWAPYGLRTSLEHAAFLVDLTRVGRSAPGWGSSSCTSSTATTSSRSRWRRPTRCRPPTTWSWPGRSSAAPRHATACWCRSRPSRSRARPATAPTCTCRSPTPTARSSPAAPGPHGLTARRRRRDRGRARRPARARSASTPARRCPRVACSPATGPAPGACWGLENREAAVRLIAGGAGQRARRQHRAQGRRPERQPLPGGRRPARQRDRAASSTACRCRRRSPVNPAESGVELPTLPVGPGRAIDALEASAVARELLGEPIVDGVVAVRRHEVATLRRAPRAPRSPRRCASPGAAEVPDEPSAELTLHLRVDAARRPPRPRHLHRAG